MKWVGEEREREEGGGRKREREKLTVKHVPGDLLGPLTEGADGAGPDPPPTPGGTLI